jgi:hypothetical protein
VQIEDGELRWYTDYDLTTLLHNLAIAGALTKAFRLGDYHGWESAADSCSCSMSDDDDRLVKPKRWWPNARGESAP